MPREFNFLHIHFLPIDVPVAVSGCRSIVTNCYPYSTLGALNAESEMVSDTAAQFVSD